MFIFGVFLFLYIIYYFTAISSTGLQDGVSENTMYLEREEKLNVYRELMAMKAMH